MEVQPMMDLQEGSQQQVGYRAGAGQCLLQWAAKPAIQAQPVQEPLLPQAGLPPSHHEPAVPPAQLRPNPYQPIQAPQFK